MTRKTSLIIYTFAHFCTDFVCFYFLFAGFVTSAQNLETATIGFLLYNVIAFGLQPIIGYISDEKTGLPIGVIGCAAIIAGVLLLPHSWIALVVIAIGNACFHVGGGIDSLVRAEGRMARSGVFVSSGVLGVAIGTLAGKSAVAIHLPISLAVISFISVCLVYLRPVASESKTQDQNSFIGELG
jgi:FSR family fosmidomycin resistance protein-like MFS transporter